MNINALKPLIENKLTAILGRQVKLGELSLSILSGTVDARDLAVADDPQFSSEPFITATVVHIGVQMSPLLLQRQILVESLEIESPQIHLVRSAANGTWNFSSLIRNPASLTQPQKQQGIPDLTIHTFRIKNGHATLNVASPGAPLLIDQIDLALDNFALAKQFPFTLSAVLPGQATFNMNGNAGPINPQDPAATNFDLKLTADKLPIDQLQSLLPAIGIKLPNGSMLQGGTLATHLTLVGPLQNLVVNGAVEFGNIRLSGFNLSSK